MDNIFIKIIYILLFLISLALVIWQTARSLNPPMDKRERIKRSLLIAIGTATCMYSGMILIYVFGVNSSLDEWSRTSYLGLICLITPFFFASFIGSYINFGVLTMLENKKNKMFKKE